MTSEVKLYRVLSESSQEASLEETASTTTSALAFQNKSLRYLFIWFGPEEMLKNQFGKKILLLID